MIPRACILALTSPLKADVLDQQLHMAPSWSYSYSNDSTESRTLHRTISAQETLQTLREAVVCACISFYNSFFDFDVMLLLLFGFCYDENTDEM